MTSIDEKANRADRRTTATSAWGLDIHRKQLTFDYLDTANAASRLASEAGTGGVASGSIGGYPWYQVL